MRTEKFLTMSLSDLDISEIIASRDETKLRALGDEIAVLQQSVKRKLDAGLTKADAEKALALIEVFDTARDALTRLNQVK